jgi:UPF0716 protein FxsA
VPLLILLFIVLPIAELYVIIQVGEAIGVLPTLALLLIDGFLGAALARSQGRAAWRRFNEAMAAGRVPGKEVFDGAAIIFGGALLLSPGFITDVLGLSLLLPPTRAVIRRVVLRGTRSVGAARPLFYVYEQRAGRAARRADPSPVPGAGRSRGFDVEGSAREVPIDPKELDDGRGD